MNKICLVLGTAAFALGRLDAATFQITSELDNSFNKVGGGFSTTVEAPIVGSLVLSYDAANPLTNGSYAWSALSNLQLSVTFPTAVGGNPVTFNQSHLDFNPAGIYIQVVNGNFFFTNSGTNSGNAGSGTSLSGNAWNGAANFINGNYLFTTQPLDNVTRMGFGGYVVEYNALYQLVDITGITPGSSGTPIYMGNYGNPTDNLAVPEPSALSLFAIGLSGLAILRRRRK